MQPAATSATPSPYITPPWQLARYEPEVRDEQLKRYTMIFQSLAALFTIILAIVAFTKRNA